MIVRKLMFIYFMKAEKWYSGMVVRNGYIKKQIPT